MPDRLFSDPRLAEIYDWFDGDRSDLDVYLDLIEEIGARSVIDVGCGTGAFASLLAQHGVDVIAVDPAPASLAVARNKPDAGRVQWYDGRLDDLPPTAAVDAVTMTGNVAQVFLSDEEWHATLRAARARLRTDGHLIGETRDPTARAWEQWTPERTYQRVVVDGVGPVENWIEVTEVTDATVTFEATYAFVSSGDVLTSTSTLRFRSRAEVMASLDAAGFTAIQIRDARDRPGLELVFLARPKPG